MSAKATGWVYEHSPYKGALFTVHHAIADSVNDMNGNIFWMSQGTLALKARISIRAAKDAIDQMVVDGHLRELGGYTPSHGGRQIRRFRLLIPKDAPVVYQTRWEEEEGEEGCDESATGADCNTQTLPVAIRKREQTNRQRDANGPAPVADKPKRTQRRTQEASHVSDDATRLCALFADLLGARDGATRPTVTWAWLGEMDRMLRIDGRDTAAVERTIRWLDKGSPPIASFWRANVRSPRTLREKWDQMADQLQAHKNRAPDKRAQRESQREREEAAINESF